MPWTTPGTAVAGEVLTAAFWNTQVRDQFRMGQPVFTNEAARDAAITSPEEGMVAYLTAPTVPAATGSTTALPTGVQTIYNGSVWVCVTPVGASESAGATTASTSYTPTLSAGTNPTVTLVTGTTAEVSFSSLISNSGANNTFASIAVSGAGTVAASDNWSIVMSSTSGVVMGRTFVITGLTAGTNTFAFNHKVATGTGTYTWRHLSVKGIA